MVAGNNEKEETYKKASQCNKTGQNPLKLCYVHCGKEGTINNAVSQSLEKSLHPVYTNNNVTNLPLI